MADALSPISSIPVEGLMQFGAQLDAGATAGGLVTASQLGQGAASLNMSPNDLRIAQDEARMKQYAQMKAQELAFDVKVKTEMVAENDIYGMALVYDEILSSTVAGAQPDQQSQRAQAFLNSTPQYQAILGNLRKMMARPTVKVNPIDDKNQPLPQRQNGLPTDLADAYSQPLSMGAYLAKAKTDINVARHVLDNTPDSRKEERAQSLGLVWSKGGDSKFGDVPRLLDHTESRQYRARELMVANIMAEETVDRQSALTIYDNRERSRIDTESRISEIQGTLGLSRQAAAQHLAYEDKRQAEAAKFNMVAANVNEIMRTMPEKIREDVSTRNAMVAMVYGANSDEAHYLAAFDQFAGAQLSPRQEELVALQKERTELNLKLRMGEAGEGNLAVRVGEFDTQRELLVHDFVDTAKMIDVDGQATMEQRKSSKRNKQAATLLGGVDPDGELNKFVRTNRTLTEAMNPNVTKQVGGTRMAMGFTGYSANPPRYATSEKPVKSAVSDYERGYNEYLSMVKNEELAWGQMGDLGTRGLYGVAMLKRGSELIDRADGTPEAAKVAGIVKALRKDFGVEEGVGDNAGDIKAKRIQALDRLNQIDIREKELRSNGVATPLDKRLQVGPTQTQANTNIHMIDAAAKEENPALKVMLYQNAGIEIPPDVARSLTQPRMAVTSGNAPGSKNFTSNEEIQSALDAGEIEYGQIIMVNGKAQRLEEQ